MDLNNHFTGSYTAQKAENFIKYFLIIILDFRILVT